jgi:site-specific recombinase XerD
MQLGNKGAKMKQYSVNPSNITSVGKNKNFQMLIQKFFLTWLLAQRNVSPQTVKFYRDSFRIFLKYLEAVHKIKPAVVSVDCLNAEYILGFLDFLEKERGNQPRTINSRLSAISSFLRFLSFEIPEYSGLLSRSLMIPYRKEEKRTMDFLTKDEYRALVDVCEANSQLGHRDRLMLLLLYNTGVRVSELVALRVLDVILDANGTPSYIHVHGKGRKERDVPLWKTTAAYLKKFMESHDKDSNAKIFANRTKDALTRSGVRYRLGCLVKKASGKTASMKRKNISPHTFRHTVALNLLQAGVDISTIAIWLGHESILTTHKYMAADMEMKRRTLEKIQEPGGNPPNFRPDNAMIAFLDSL